jgi:hypothetical protein
MMVTEKKAAEMWCPLSRAASVAGANRFEYQLADTMCIGSRCMAWRKDHAAEYDEFGNLPGYCGAFGKVEP